MCARSAAGYEGEVWAAKERQSQLVDAVCKMRPRVLLHRADVSEGLRPEWPHIKKEEAGEERHHIKEEEEDDELHHIKEEELECLYNKRKEEPPHIKEEKWEHFHIEQQHQQMARIKKEEEPPYVKEAEERVTELPSTGVPLKREDEAPSENSGGAEPASSSSSSSSRHATTEGEGDRRGPSQADGLLAPLSDGDRATSHSPYTEDDDDDDDEAECHHEAGRTDKKRWECSQCGKTFASKCSLKVHMTTHTGEKPFACSVCGKRFSHSASLRSHTRTHTDVSEGLHRECPHKEEEENEAHHHMKEEKCEHFHIEEQQHIKKEEEEEDVTVLPSTGVPLKSEDEGPSENSGGAEPPSSGTSSS
ncbi:zinc finger protein with KRAB and SCAN domains 1-like isoform X3 [Phyllopteryx taeniolatus]|uniref:zinc finger protein with KRAB and SCAN domains 1-like isoform X3 n=1 Tax=Phyllopteryx taeniolatus TaxID=161469 RepID=UPI002AD3100B|nr:zinc finger protein with KRAB and SCAN domains 1-like isoform X3 [Phyllopteryx taeniolatus]